MTTTHLDRLLVRHPTFTHGGKASQRAFAKYLLEKWPEGFEESAPPLGTITTYVNRLAQGQSEWWVKRPAIWAVVLDALGPEADALLPTTSNDGTLWRFADFPDLEPLDLRREVPPELGTTPLFSLPTTDGPHCIWIPHGGGRRLAARVLAAAHPDRVRLRSVRSLRDARELGPPPGGWLVLEVQEFDFADGEVADGLGRLGRVLVLAPAPADSGPGDLEGHDPDPDVIPWTAQVWRPRVGWLEDLVEWVWKRIPDRESSFDPEAVIRQLYKLDPAERWFQTPGDVLPLLAFAHDKSESMLTEHDLMEVGLAQEVLGQRLDRNTRERLDHAATWARTHGVTAVLGAAAARLPHLELPLEGSLTQHEWAELLPPEHASGPDPAAIAKALADASASRKLLSSAEALATAQELVQPVPAVAVQYLASVGLLHRSDGAYDLHPAWTGRLAARQLLQDALSTDTLEWGGWCLGPDRQELVDQALDDLDARHLLGLARLAASRMTNDLQTIGAVEALFSAVARRLYEPGMALKAADVTVLHALWERQLGLLVRRYIRGERVPRTRPGTGDSGQMVHQWRADLWTWSLRLPPPPGGVPEGMEWLLPGWATPTWATAPRHLGSVASDYTDPEEWPPVFHRLLRMVPEVLDRVTGDVPRDLAMLLAPEVLVRQALAGSVSPTVAKFVLMGVSFMQIEFMRLAERAQDNPRIAASVFEAIARVEEDNSVVLALQTIKEHAPALHRALPSNVVVAHVERALANKTLNLGFNLRVRLLDRLEEPTRSDVVLWLMDHGAVQHADILDAVDRNFRLNLDARVLMRLLRSPEPTALHAAPSLWHHDPVGAEAHAIGALRDGPDDDLAASRLVPAAPEAHYSALLDVIERLDHHPEWLTQWLHRLVLNFPALAARAHGLVR